MVARRWLRSAGVSLLVFIDCALDEPRYIAFLSGRGMVNHPLVTSWGYGDVSVIFEHSLRTFNQKHVLTVFLYGNHS